MSSVALSDAQASLAAILPKDPQPERVSLPPKTERQVKEAGQCRQLSQTPPPPLKAWMSQVLLSLLPQGSKLGRPQARSGNGWQ